jgi:hypothetical protein
MKRTFRCFINLDHCKEEETQLVCLIENMAAELRRKSGVIKRGHYLWNTCDSESGVVLGHYVVDYEPSAIAI